MSKSSPLSWIPGYCTPVVYQDNGLTYEAVPCGCPAVECPGYNPYASSPFTTVVGGLIATLLIVALIIRQRARKRTAILDRS